MAIRSGSGRVRLFDQPTMALTTRSTEAARGRAVVSTFRFGLTDSPDIEPHAFTDLKHTRQPSLNVGKPSPTPPCLQRDEGTEGRAVYSAIVWSWNSPPSSSWGAC